ncbi:FliH/SctL family protein [Sneathiella chinensis]|uniref:Flagellar assembly protein FliH n=1 Tax=Sneathiella chinensis TaxID=349750 RepID=A0ABQ5U1W2_9PROT|nr:FliH/SctL family protein [Sneathiella chinensis]GLQ05849.1 flagellar assembly protein FliH [Sneathiella chinensis]
MSSNSRFLFDTEFGTPQPPKKEEVTEVVPEGPPLEYTAGDLDQARAEGREAGMAEGRAEALQGIEATMAQTLEMMNAQLQATSGDHASRLENIRCEAASLAVAIANRLAPAMMERAPGTEVLGMIEECLADLHDEPRFVVRASEMVCDALKDRIDKLAQAAGFMGKIILLPDETKTGSDCRIEWADGGVERNLAETQQKIAEIVDRFVRSGGQETSSHP